MRETNAAEAANGNTLEIFSPAGNFQYFQKVIKISEIIGKFERNFLTDDVRKWNIFKSLFLGTGDEKQN